LHLVSDDTLSISRTVYDLSPSKLPAHTRSANASEKDARAALYGAVKRVLTDRDIVILDGPNYIKGWRYQLYCESKAVRTPSVVLQIGCRPEVAKAINQARLARDAAKQASQVNEEAADQEAEGPKIEVGDEEAYEQANWDNLVFRYEEPNAMNRWDSPLFTIVWDDDEKQANSTFEGIWNAVAGEARKLVRPNQATVQRGKDPGSDYLYLLERETQDIVKRILEQQNDDGGGEVKIPRSGGSSGDDLIVELPGSKKIGIPQLQRLRRNYTALNRGGIGLENIGNLAIDRIKENFVGYLNDSFEKDE
jgi:protein KTI12